MTMRIISILFITILITSCAPLHPPLWQSTLPPESHPAFAARLSQAGSNRTGLEKAFELTPPALHPYVALLIERMPTVDLASCSPQLLARSVILSDSLRRILPYAAAVPEEIYRDYVLPLRVSQEPLEDFRPLFVSQILPLVKDCTSVAGAAVAVNRWCGSKVGFKSTQSRDQGPFETLKSGYGRCEEMMIFFSDACRALCIPTREAWTPWWPYQDNNHAWTEVWTPEGWKYTGACEPRDHLNEAWFSDPVKRAALVLASKQGPPLPGEKVYRRGDRHSIINVTAAYTNTAILNLKLTQAGQPLPGREVMVSLFNFGSLRPVARVTTDSLGHASVDLGKGDYTVSFASDKPQAVIVEHRPPISSSVALDITQPQAPPANFWLRCDP
jgi:hypothetical protein